MGAKDPVLWTAEAYKNDTDPKKVNLGVGAYRDDNQKPVVFSAVKKAELELVNDVSLDKEYAPMDGIAEFNRLSKQLVFGNDSKGITEDRIVTAQSISGTGSLRVAFEFIRHNLGQKDVYLPQPTWAAHSGILTKSNLNVQQYPYYDEKTKGINFAGLTTTLKNAQPGSVILLHPSAHNPTGVDPNQDQWKQIAQICQDFKLIPFFDCAYQGFASGNIETDVYSIRLFESMGLEMFVTQSYAKNMGLYGERVGAVHIVCEKKETAQIVLSQLKLIIRPLYSNPPIHGARIVAKILSNPQLRQEWLDQLKQVSSRIILIREQLQKKLEDLQVPGTWNHITDQIGMFSYTGLTPEQCDILINKYHIYLLRNGRISMAGINSMNIDYLSNSIKQAIIQQ